MGTRISWVLTGTQARIRGRRQARLAHFGHDTYFKTQRLPQLYWAINYGSLHAYISVAKRRPAASWAATRPKSSTLPCVPRLQTTSNYSPNLWPIQSSGRQTPCQLRMTAAVIFIITISTSNHSQLLEQKRGVCFRFLGFRAPKSGCILRPGPTRTGDSRVVEIHPLSPNMTP